MSQAGFGPVSRGIERGHPDAGLNHRPSCRDVWVTEGGVTRSQYSFLASYLPPHGARTPTAAVR
jgi:hypothetical protein